MSNVWRAQVNINEDDHFIYDEILSVLDAGIDVSEKNGQFILTAYVEDTVSENRITEIFNNIHSILGDERAVEITSIPQSDWKESLKQSFPPLQVASFFIHSFDETAPEGCIDLKIPAGLAFGTGEHPTTAGCLTLYAEQMATRTFENVLDMGCGSAILAMAAAKKQQSKCVAVDIDEDSVATAIDNIAMNGCAENIQCAYSNGFTSDIVQSSAPYQLIFANILANPLIEMAEDMINALASDGVIILSGFTTEQKEKVVEAYTSRGLTLKSDVVVNDWVATTLTKA